MIAFDDLRTKRRQLLSRISVFVVALFLTFSENAWGHVNHLIGQCLFAAGIMLTGVGMVGRAWSLAYVAGNKNALLVCEGPYSLCRNPLYFSSFVAALGVGMCTETLTIPLLVAVLFYTLYRNTIMQEEAQLRQLFGADFESYLERTPRFWPSRRHFRESATMQITPRFFRRGIISLLYFLAVVSFAELLEALHEFGILPTYVWIY